MEINDWPPEKVEKVLITKGLSASAYFTGSADSKGPHKQVHLTLFLENGQEVKMILPVLSILNAEPTPEHIIGGDGLPSPPYAPV